MPKDQRHNNKQAFYRFFDPRKELRATLYVVHEDFQGRDGMLIIGAMLFDDDDRRTCCSFRVAGSERVGYNVIKSLWLEK